MTIKNLSMIMKNLSNKINDLLQYELDPAFKRRAGIILNNLNLAPGDQVLEVGCGRGFYLGAILKLVKGVMVVGLDNNEKYLKMARTISGGKAKVIKGNAVYLPFAKGTFDKVICSEVLEHVREDWKVASEIYRVLKPGGKALISVPNKNYPYWLDPLNYSLEKLLKVHIPKNIWWLAGIWADHVRLYTEEELVNKLKKGGFKNFKIWRATRFGVWGEHFLLYGIGKNLVEMGLFPEFDRFGKRSKKSLLLTFVLKFIYLEDKRNDEEQTNQDSEYVNIMVEAKK